MCLRYRHYERVNTLLMLTAGMDKILDVGCGYGDLSLELSDKGKNVVLLDIDLKKLLIAKRRFKRFGLKGELVCGDAHQLPFRDNIFDASFSNQVVEHVAEPFKILLEKLRVSKLKAIVMCGHLIAIHFPYHKMLIHIEIETIPDLKGYDEIIYLNHQVLPLNSGIAIALMKIIASLPIFRRIFAGNLVKVYHKRRSKRRERRKWD